MSWTEAGVNIHAEFGDRDDRGQSIHEYMRNRLVESTADAVFYDHGSGEMADFVTVTTEQDLVRVALYHCKAASGDRPGENLNDAYEVCGQAVKCIRWARPREILESVERRLNRESGGSRFEKGDINLLQQALGPTQRRRVVFESVIVQPGFSRVALGDRVGPLLAAADEYLYELGRFTRLRVIGSA